MDKCIGDHSKHMCQIPINDDMEKVKLLVKNARWICRNCRRVANEKQLLCNPVEL